MGILKKKKSKKEKTPPSPIMEMDVVMHNSTQVVADEEGEVCSALFQTDKPLSPAEWQMLAQKAREGARFVLSVMEEEDEE